jgi:hypothetical protein
MESMSPQAATFLVTRPEASNGHGRRDPLTCDTPAVISPGNARTVASPRDRPDDRFRHLERGPARERHGGTWRPC